ncbi:hypothetical protein LNQ49_16915 [Flavobacterium sp. F-65]|uniref:Uncharacterized protein n=1 Tax=Flavobacterium pisciphilum TaxID=2893755 RepID=A0ABS8MWU3_9FLAO|nr:hypothetical protein [Flavobacterium sp. F-65]MCC9073261.1 hypothetical protein [Flavobacterium sp. F-65]
MRTAISQESNNVKTKDHKKIIHFLSCLSFENLINLKVYTAIKGRNIRIIKKSKSFKVSIDVLRTFGILKICATTSQS